jgi:hypothetical protein
MFAIKLAFAGIGHLVAHWSIGVLIIAACVVIEFASGWLIGYVPILEKPVIWLQKRVIFIAAGTALVLLGEYIGARDIAARCDAKAAVVNSEVHKAVTRAKPPAAGTRGKWDTDQ